MGCTQTKPLAPSQRTTPLSAPSYADQYREENGPFFRTRPEQTRDVIYADQGPFSQQALPAETLLEAFFKAKTRHGTKPALKVERPAPQMDSIGRAFPSLPDEEWKTWTWNEYWEESRMLAKSLLECGLQRYDGVVVFGFNAPEWHISQMGITMAGGLTAGIYPTDAPDILAYKMVHCRARVAIVEDAAKLRKLEEVLENIPRLTHIVGYSPLFRKHKVIRRRDATGVQVMPWADFLLLGKDTVSDAQLDVVIAEQTPADCFAVYYTSGASGFPRGVMLSHDNVIVEAHCAFKMVPEVGNLEQERVLSYLPLSHCAAVMFDMIAPIVGSAHLSATSYFTTYFARTYDLKSGLLKDRIKLVRPTLFFGVPRVYEKLMEQESNTLPTLPFIREAAKRIGREFYTNFQVGGSGKVPLGWDFANKQWFLPTKQHMGFDQAKAIFTGGAPIQPQVVEYFAGLGIQLLDSYGLSETSGAALASLNTTYRLGSCGMAMMANEVCVMRRYGEIGETCKETKNLESPNEEEQGELCFRGRTVMLGYLSCADSFDEQRILAKNRDVIDKLGWLHSGDKGCKDGNGMFRITGRFKEVIISAGGASIAPTPIEDSIKRLSKGVVSNVLMVGDKRKFNVALITLASVDCNSDLLAGPAAKLVPGITFISEAMHNPIYIKKVEKFVLDTNFDGMVCPSHACQVQKFTIMPHDFSEEQGDFSTSHKLRRSRMEARYAKTIDAMFASSPSVTYIPFVV